MSAPSARVIVVALTPIVSLLRKRVNGMNVALESKPMPSPSFASLERRERYEINSGRYPPSATFIADYPFKVTWALGVGVVASTLIIGVLGVVRRVVGRVRW